MKKAIEEEIRAAVGQEHWRCVAVINNVRKHDRMDQQKGHRKGICIDGGLRYEGQRSNATVARPIFPHCGGVGIHQGLRATRQTRPMLQIPRKRK